MRSSRRASRRSDGEEEEAEDNADDEPSGPPRRHPARSRRPHRGGVQEWSDASDPGESDSSSDASAIEEEGRWFHRPKRPVFFRARDSVFFEPLVALALIVLILVSLWAYTQNWPPMYVVESDSMQHGYVDQVGLLNTGDLVLAQRLDASAIVPYFAGLQTGYSTYGEYGDVILYHPNGDPSGAPIIHRALAWVTLHPNGSYDIPDLNGLPCGSSPAALYQVPAHVTGCGAFGITGSVELLHIGWKSVNVTVLPTTFGGHSGFLTMGDNNFAPNGTGALSGDLDQDVISTLVETGWIVGAARGMLPWFGSLKLVLGGDAGQVPPQSWQFLGITIAGFFLAGMGIHYALRAEGVEDERRREREEDEAEERAERPSSRWTALNPWSREEREDPDDEDAYKEGERPPVKGGWFRRLRASGSTGGRPSPVVRRGSRPHPHRAEPKRHRRHPGGDEDL